MSPGVGNLIGGFRGYERKYAILVYVCSVVGLNRMLYYKQPVTFARLHSLRTPIFA